MENHQVSVIIPVYGAEKYIQKCLDSIEQQTIKNLEIICVDDGSLDRSVEIIEFYQSKYNNIKLYRQENLGAGAARNVGIERAAGEYLAFVDPDDYYYSDTALECLYFAAVKNDADICAGNVTYVDDKGSAYLPEVALEWYIDRPGIVSGKNYQCPYCHVKNIFKKEFLKKNHLFYPLYRRGEDPPFMLRAISLAKVIYCVTDVVYAYRKIKKDASTFSKQVVIDLLSGSLETLDICIKNQFNLTYESVACWAIMNYRLLLKRDYDVAVGFLGRLDDCIKIGNLLFDKDFSILPDYKNMENEFIRRSYTCALWGFGNLGKELLENCNNINIIEIYDIDSRKYGQQFNGKYVKQYEKSTSKVDVILITHYMYINEILPMLNPARVRYVFDVYHFITYGWEFNRCLIPV